MARRASIALATLALAACHGGGAAGSNGADGATPLSVEPPGLQWLDAPAPNETNATRVSADGQVVIGTFVTPGVAAAPLQAFRWARDTGVVALGSLPGLPASDAVALCADGGLVYGIASDGAGASRSFLWSTAGGVGPVGDPDFFVTDVDAEAFVLVGKAAAGPTSVTAGVAEALFTPPPASADANAVSADGATIVGRTTTSGPPQEDVGFVWTAAGVQTIVGPTPYTDARDVSADGTAVVGFFYDGADPTPGANPFRGFVWRAASGAKDIGAFSPTACDGTGDVVVGNTQNPPHAYVWNALDGARELGAALTAAGVDLGGATLDAANDVSSDGRVVVGSGTSADGKVHAFRAVLPR